MTVLEVKNVSIRYITGDFKDIGLKEYVMRRLKHDYHINEFWADKDISFFLEKGEMMGIIGTNGAGKSTLLKAISGIMKPTEGSVKQQGSIAALLELASGFDGDLTVRENTYLRGAMLGYTREFMDEKYDEIIDFAELQNFQDRPFRQLSSGMKSRLAFSIASLVQPDILILDEVLSVGDGAFRKKSEMKMKEIIAGGAATILVSHSIQQVQELCTKVLWLDHGRQVALSDDVQRICDDYQRFLSGELTLNQVKELYPSTREHSGDTQLDTYNRTTKENRIVQEKHKITSWTEEKKRNCMKILWFTVLSVFGVFISGNVISKLIKANAFELEFAYLIVIGLIVCIFVCLFSHRRSNFSIRSLGILLLAVSLCAVSLHLSVFKEKSNVSVDRYINKKSPVSLMSVFLSQYGMEKHGPISKDDYMNFSKSVYPTLLYEKEVSISSDSVNNPGMSALISAVDPTVRNYGSISPEEYTWIISQHDPQELRFIENADDTEYHSIYFLTDELWDESPEVYGLNCEGNTVFVPSLLMNKPEIIEGQHNTEDYSFKQICVIFHEDTVITRLLKNGEYSHHPRFLQFAYLIYLFLVGAIALYPMRGVLRDSLVIYLSFPIGVLIYILTVILLGFLNVPLTINITFLVPVFSALLLFVISAKKYGISKEQINLFGFCALMVVWIVFAYFSFFPQAEFSWDSYDNIYLARTIAHNKCFPSNLSRLTSYSFVYPIIHIGSSMLGVDYNYSIIPSMSGLSLLSIFLLQVRLLEGENCKRWKCWIISGISILVYSTTPLFRLSGLWILNNEMIGLWTGIAVCLFLLFQKTNQTEYLVVAYIPFLFVIFARIEGMLFALVLLVCLKSIISDQKHYKRLVCLSAFVSVSIFLLLFSNMSDSYDQNFWTPGKAGVQAVLMLLYAVYICFEKNLFRFSYLRLAGEKLSGLMLAFLGFSIVCLIPIRWETAKANTSAIIDNFFVLGSWGIVWILAIILISIICFCFNEDRRFCFFSQYIAGFVLALFALMLLRTIPLRSSSSDSACRMMLHLVPVVGTCLALMTGHCFGKDVAETNVIDK